MFARQAFLQRFEAAAAPVDRRIHADAIAVWTVALRTQPLDQLALEVRRDGMLELLGFVVHLVPFQSEDLGQHALDQVMAVEQTVGDFTPRRRESDLPLGRARESVHRGADA